MYINVPLMYLEMTLKCSEWQVRDENQPWFGFEHVISQPQAKQLLCFSSITHSLLHWLVSWDKAGNVYQQQLRKFLLQMQIVLLDVYKSVYWNKSCWCNYNRLFRRLRNKWFYSILNRKWNFKNILTRFLKA